MSALFVRKCGFCTLLFSFYRFFNRVSSLFVIMPATVPITIPASVPEIISTGK